MNFPTLAPNVPRPSAGASDRKLSDDEIRLRIRRFLEEVAQAQTYVHRSALTEGFVTKPRPDVNHYRNLINLRDKALSAFNAQDAAAGRPFVTSVVLNPRNLEPDARFFEDLARARSVRLDTEEEKREAHLHEFEAAKVFPWASGSK
jgi:hypothetical protein